MNLMMEDLVNYWYLWTLAALFFGSIAFAFGFVSVENKKNTVKRFLPMLCVEFAIFLFSAMKAIKWAKRGVSFWWVIFEHGPEVYIAVIALVFIPLGYLAGAAFARKKA